MIVSTTQPHESVATRRPLTLEPISAERFAPFGRLVLPPAIGADRLDLIDDLVNTRAGAHARLSLAVAEPKALPFQAVVMERHAYSSQAFLPIDCATYLVMVAPHGVDGLPDMTGLRAFRVPGDVGINYKADVWHHPLTVLERTGRFTVFTFVDGTAADEQVVTLSELVTLVEE